MVQGHLDLPNKLIALHQQPLLSRLPLNPGRWMNTNVVVIELEASFGLLFFKCK